MLRHGSQSKNAKAKCRLDVQSRKEHLAVLLLPWLWSEGERRLNVKVKAYRHKRQLQLQRQYCVTDRAGVQPIGRRVSPEPRDFDLLPNSYSSPDLPFSNYTDYGNNLPTPKGCRAEFAEGSHNGDRDTGAGPKGFIGCPWNLFLCTIYLKLNLKIICFCWYRITDCKSCVDRHTKPLIP